MSDMISVAIGVYIGCLLLFCCTALGALVDPKDYHMDFKSKERRYDFVSGLLVAVTWPIFLLIILCQGIFRTIRRVFMRFVNAYRDYLKQELKQEAD